MDIKQVLLLAGVSTTLSGCSWIGPFFTDQALNNWQAPAQVQVAQRNPAMVQMPARTDIAMQPVARSEFDGLGNSRAYATLPARSNGQSTLTQKTLAKAINTTSCALQRAALGHSLRKALSERMDIYTAQVESLAASSLSVQMKVRLVRGLDTEFQNLQDKTLGLDYLRDTLYGLCQMHTLGLIKAADYSSSKRSLLKTAAESLSLAPMKNPLRKASSLR